jgi:orotidine-5'-phosphate decarboxylase
MPFKAKMQEISISKKTNLVLALDLPFESNPQKRLKIKSSAEAILEAVSPYVCAIKVNHHLALPLGLFDGVKDLVSKIHDLGLLAIMDAKINDIGSTNEVIAEYYFEVGFDAVIANPFIGWEDGLKPIFEVSHRLDRGVILLVYMSHKGAVEGYGQTVLDPVSGKGVAQYLAFAEKARKLNADGAVVGATRPEKIAEVKAVLGDNVPIYSPGVGAQGGSAVNALKAGANYLIVGREITMAENPAEAAMKLLGSIKLT